MIAMPPQSSNSFIPKSKPNAKDRTTKKRSSPLLSVLVSGFFGATIIASVALVAYEWYLQSQLNQTTVELAETAESFSEADLSRVLDFNARLTAAAELFSKHISINRSLTQLAQSTASTIQFSGISLSREDRDVLSVTADVSTQDIGSVIAQRNILENNANFTRVTFADLQLAFPGESDADSESANQGAEVEPVSVSIELDVPVDSVLYDPASDPIAIDTTDDFTTGSSTQVSDSEALNAVDNFDI